jgi:hypothetical protein
MAGTRRVLTPTMTALIVAVAAAAVAGYLVSRSQGPVQPVAPTSNPVHTPDGPFSTDGYSAADDVADNQLVMFGGDLSLDQTWVWNGGKWTLRHPRKSPSGREEAAMAYDPQLHMVLLFGGVAPPQNGLNDTWGWDGTTWHELDASVNRPPPGVAAMTWDPTMNAMVLVPGSSPGTDTWTWSGTHWLDHRPPEAPEPDVSGPGAIAFDPDAHVLAGVGFGNVVGTNIGSEIETWIWNGTTWRQITTPHVPTAYGILGMAWDPVTARLLLFGNGPGTQAPLRQWFWTGTDWTQLPGVTDPKIIEGLLTSDPGALLLVGELSESPGALTPIDVWEWTGSAWIAQMAR